MSKKPKFSLFESGSEFPVLAGSDLFRTVDTYGVPLDVAVGIIKDKGFRIDWLGFYDSAVASGWGASGVVSKLEAAWEDVFGDAYRDEALRRLRHCIAVRGSVEGLRP